MKLVLVLCLAIVAVVYARPDDKYTSKFDNINIDEIIGNDRLMYNYVKCLKGDGKCTPEGTELKRLLPDALETGCNKCTEKQKSGSEKVIRHLINNKPDWWKELSSLYDPEGKYRVKYENEANKHGIKLPDKA